MQRLDPLGAVKLNSRRQPEAEAAERFETWGGGKGGTRRTPSQAHTPTQVSQNVLCVVRWHKQTSLQ